MAKLYRIQVVIFLSFLSLSLDAQQPDFGTWLSYELKNDISKKWSWTLNAESRIAEKFSKISDFLFESGIKYNLVKHIDLIGLCRYSRSYEQDFGYINEYRFTGGTILWIKPGRFKLALQEKLQLGSSEVYSKGDNIVLSRNIRSKFAVSYNIPKSKVNPYLSAELFFDVSPYEKKEFNKERYKAGFEYNINKNYQLDIFLQYQQKLNSKNQNKLFVVGLAISYKLPSIKNNIEEPYLAE